MKNVAGTLQSFGVKCAISFSKLGMMTCVSFAFRHRQIDTSLQLHHITVHAGSIMHDVGVTRDRRGGGGRGEGESNLGRDGQAPVPSCQ